MKTQPKEKEKIYQKREGREMVGNMGLNCRILKRFGSKIKTRKTKKEIHHNLNSTEI